ncbi:GTP-sensing pleiotropic transcriptional regulator CodY, partial [Streptococcus pyogenes]
LADIIHCNACIINSDGEVLGYYLKDKLNNDRVEEFFTNKQFPAGYIKAAAQVYDTLPNIPADSDLTAIPVESRADYPDSVTTLAP